MKHAIEVASGVLMCMLSFMKIRPGVKNLLERIHV
jgi:hypothetical protein